MELNSKEEIKFILGFGIENLVLISLILLNILDFTGLLTEELDYIKKIISWTALILILKSAHLSNIFFGIKNKFYDLYFPISLFILSLKDFLSFSEIAQKEFQGIFSFFFRYIYSHYNQIEVGSVYIGIILIIFWSFYIALKNKEIGKKDCIYKLIKKKYGELEILTFFKVLIIQFIFYVIFFNMFIEWLAISVDSAIFTLGFIIFILFRKKIKEGAINSLSSFGEEFYEKVIKLFKYKNGLNFGIILMYLLHLLTDIAIFIIPFVMFISNPLYMDTLGEEMHTNLTEIFYYHSLSSLGSGFIALIFHLISILFVAQLLVYPLIIFLRRMEDKRIDMNNTNIALFFSTMVGFCLNPLIKMTAITKDFFVGVDFSHELIKNLDYGYAFFVICISIIVFVIVKMILDYVSTDKIKKFFNCIIEIISVFFVLIYFSMYVYSYISFMIRLFFLITSIDFSIFMFTFIFILVNIGFYIYSTLLYIKEVLFLNN